MTVNQNELLSALVDGELQGEELEQALDLLQSDKQAMAQFQRYQIVKDALHGHVSTHKNSDLTIRISDSLRDEPTFSNKSAQIISFPKQFWKQASSLAVAASIGALAVIGMTTEPQVSEHTMAAMDASPTSIIIAKKTDRWTVDESEIEDRLNTYLLDHNEYTNTSDVFSYARVVSYSVGQ